MKGKHSRFFFEKRLAVKKLSVLKSNSCLIFNSVFVTGIYDDDLEIITLDSGEFGKNVFPPSHHC